MTWRVEQGDMREPTFHESARARGVSPDEETAQWLGEAIAGDVEAYEVDGTAVRFTRNGLTYLVHMVSLSPDDEERIMSL